MTEPAGALLPCGCCEGTRRLTPASVENRPGLSALAYRVGTHGSFKATMKADLSGRRELGELTTREDDDPSIALIDAWATVLDVLTFYQERIANEGFLRTAAEARSVTELARAIGYEPSPGVAASTYLAFELETAKEAPSSASIPVGTKVQTVPGPGERSQTFETVESIEARPTWNALRAQRSARHVPGMDDTEAFLEGAATGLARGDAVLFVGRERERFGGSEQWDFRLVKAVETDLDRDLTRITWERGLGWRQDGRQVTPAKEDVRCHALRQRAGLFGHNAPDPRSMPDTVQRAYGFKAGMSDWPRLKISTAGAQPNKTNPPNTIYLDAVYPKLVPGGWLVLSSPTYEELYRPDPKLGDTAIAEASRTDFTLTARTTSASLEGEQLTAMFDTRVRDTVVFLHNEELPLAEVPITDPVQGDTIRLDTVVDGLQKERTVLISGRRPRVTVADSAHLTMSTVLGGVKLAPRDVLEVMAPYVDNADGTRTWKLKDVEGREGSVTARREELAATSAPETDEPLVEVAVLEAAEVLPSDPDRTIVRLARPLAGTYDRTSFVLLGNVARATHGESKGEVLGGGDASKPFRTFSLQGSPLTYIPSADPSGAASTLRIRVNGVVWEERPTLFGLGPRDRNHSVSIGEEGKVTVEFGDGATGARVPTGTENVEAAYRVGTGRAGNVKAEQLSLLQSRPLGVRSVRNPLPAAGGADPESRDEARTNAPRTVLTLGRVVSLIDFEDFARAFAGIAKAQAVAVWSGETRIVFVTVAGIDGRAVDEQSVTYRNLVRAIRAAGDLRQPFEVRSYEPVTFDVAAGLFLDPGYDWDRVRLSVVQALRAAYSFEARDFGQPVTASEVVATIQRIEGVLAVDLDRLNVTGAGPPTTPVLLPAGVRRETGDLLPAQLLILNPNEDGVSLTWRQ